MLASTDIPQPTSSIPEGTPSETTPRRRYWSPRLSNSPKHQPGAPSPRTSPKRTPKAIAYPAAVVAFAACVLFPPAGSPAERMLPKTRVLRVIDALPLPNHVLGTFQRIAEPANAFQCSCSWRSYAQVGAKIAGRKVGAPLSTRQVISNTAELEAFGVIETHTRFLPGLGNVPNTFKVRVPPDLEAAAKQYADDNAEQLRELSDQRAAWRDPAWVEAFLAGAEPEDPPEEDTDPVVDDAHQDAPPAAEPTPPLLPPPRQEGRVAFDGAMAALRARHPATADQWFELVAFDGLADGVCSLRVNNTFTQEWIEKHFLADFLGELVRLAGETLQIRWTLDPSIAGPGLVRARPVPSRPGAPPPEVLAEPERLAAAEGAILELLRALPIYQRLPRGMSVEAFASSLTMDMVKTEKRPLAQVLVGLWQCTTKPGRTGQALVDFAVGCIRGADVKEATDEIRAILVRAKRGETALRARAPPAA